MAATLMKECWLKPICQPAQVGDPFDVLLSQPCGAGQAD
jgi:hypothetical protein